MQSESLISRPMGFCWDGSLLFYVVNHCSSVEPFCYFYTKGLYARLVESEPERPNTRALEISIANVIGGS